MMDGVTDLITIKYCQCTDLKFCKEDCSLNLKCGKYKDGLETKKVLKENDR